MYDLLLQIFYLIYKAITHNILNVIEIMNNLTIFLYYNTRIKANFLTRLKKAIENALMKSVFRKHPLM